VKRSESEKLHRRPEGVPGADEEVQSSGREFGIDVLDSHYRREQQTVISTAHGRTPPRKKAGKQKKELTAIPSASDGVSELERKGDDGARLALLVGELDDVRVRGEEVDDVVRLFLGEEVGSDDGRVGRDDDVRVVSLDGGESDVGVLDVDTGRGMKRWGEWDGSGWGRRDG
jgi:hypothetical protein